MVVELLVVVLLPVVDVPTTVLVVLGRRNVLVVVTGESSEPDEHATASAPSAHATTNPRVPRVNLIAEPCSVASRGQWRSSSGRSSAGYRSVVDAQFCYLTTKGRRTGRPHTIEIWFAAAEGTLYLGGGPRSDWVRNLVAGPAVTVRVEGQEGPATARLVETGTDEDARARRLLLEKYQPPGSHDLDSWGRTALIVAIDLSD